MSKYSTKGKPWLIPGAKNVESCKTSREVMEKAGINFTVDKCPLVAKMPFDVNNADTLLDDMNDGKCFSHSGNIYRDCPNAFATYRTDENIPLGIVKSRYEIVQNVDAFAFFDDAIGKDRAIWQTAGFFGDGERVFVSAKLPNDIRVNGDVIENYLVFANSHDGSTGVNILFIPIRVVCQNTLNSAIKTSDCFVRFRHTRSVHNNISMADDLLGIAKMQSDEVQQLYTQLANTKVTDSQVKRFIAQTFAEDKIAIIDNYDAKFGVDKIIDLDYGALKTTGISTRMANMMHKTYDYYKNGIGQEDIVNTAYGAYNAVTGYYSNIDNSTGEDRMKSMLYGRSATVMANSLGLATRLIA